MLVHRKKINTTLSISPSVGAENISYDLVSISENNLALFKCNKHIST